MHKLLERQLRRCFGSVDAVPPELRPLLELVDQAYEQSDHDRQLLERSMDLTSSELLDLNRQLSDDRAQLADNVTERTRELMEANLALEREIAVREKATAAIKESEGRYRALFEDSLDPICVVAPDGSLLDLNRAAVETLEFDSRETAIGADVQRFYVEPRERERLLAEVRERGFVEGRELELETLRGRRIVVLASTVPLRNERGEIVALRTTLRDITQRRSLQRELAEAQKMEAVGRLAGGVAHDFNNLLTAISGCAELLSMQLPYGENLHDLVVEISEAARRGTELTQRLLAFGRRQVMVEERVALNDLVSGVRVLLRRLIGDHIELDVELSAEDPTILADRSQMEQVLINLAINARDAMPDGGRLTFETALVQIDHGGPTGVPGGEYATLTVRDTGSGIDDEIRDFIFEPFFTTKKDGGTGLGLATVYGIVQQSAGYVRVASRPGEGTAFELSWPSVDAEPAPEVGEPAVEATAAQDEPPGGGEQILVVDDDDSVRRLTSRLLEHHGYRTWTAGGGEEALAIFEQHGSAIDLLVSDVVMPGMQGPELADELRRRSPRIGVLLMSGYADTLEEFRGTQESLGTRFMQKPFRGAELAAAVRELLHHG